VALQRLEFAAARLSGDARVRAYLAEAYRRMGRNQDAIRGFNDALALSPDPQRRAWIETQLRLASGAAP
jgi:predicted RNA polymerase sigma factor